jgi:ferredoxin-NADP reductase
MESQPVQWTATVRSLTKETHKVYVADLIIGGTQPMHFQAGQYGSFAVGPKIWRNFSFTTTPGEAPKIGICADITPMGPGSVWLMKLTAGQKVQFLGPLGRFTVDTRTTAPKIFVATGTGIAPIRPMIVDCLIAQPDVPTFLFWGVRHDSDVFWLDEFRRLRNRYRNFGFILTLSQPSNLWKGAKGRVTAHVFSMKKDLVKSEYYLCGNRDMLDDVRTGLRARNVPEDHIKTELFY